jgi:hypothetical protein
VFLLVTIPKNIKNHIVQNQISIANEFNNYILNTAESTSTKGINEKKDASPLQYLFEYFNQPFKDVSWPYTSLKDISWPYTSLKDTKQNNKLIEE